MSLDKDILVNYGGLHTNSLTHVLHVNSTDDSKINLLQHSPYIDDKEIQNVLLDKSDNFNIYDTDDYFINSAWTTILSFLAHCQIFSRLFLIMQCFCFKRNDLSLNKHQTLMLVSHLIPSINIHTT